MNASEKCLALIRSSENFAASPYLCPAGIPTIGYGSTRYEDSTPVALTDQPITVARANAILASTLAGEYEKAVTRYVTVPLTQGQFDALVDFAYNAGAQNLRTSTLLKRLNEGDYDRAAAEFGRWIFGNGKILNGLVTRRAAEKLLFLGKA
jgi:lysozyme